MAAANAGLAVTPQSVTNICYDGLNAQGTAEKEKAFLDGEAAPSHLESSATYDWLFDALDQALNFLAAFLT